MNTNEWMDVARGQSARACACAWQTMHHASSGVCVYETCVDGVEGTKSARASIVHVAAVIRVAATGTHKACVRRRRGVCWRAYPVRAATVDAVAPPRAKVGVDAPQRIVAVSVVGDDLGRLG